MSGSSNREPEAVLVTGGHGFVGSWLVERLLEDGARVVVPQRPGPEGSRFEREGLGERCQLVDFDLLDLTSVLRVLNEQSVSLVFHLAAKTIVSAANEDPLGAFEVNVRGTYNVLEAARLLAESAPGVVVASSYHAYGRHNGGPYSERTPLRPTYPYDTSKACADILARCYGVMYALPVAVTRMANIYGGGDFNWSRLVPDVSRALTSGETPVIASDGSPERDYLYVEDAVEAFLAVARSLGRADLRGRAWNVGLDRPISVLEVVRTLIAASKQDIEPEIRGEVVPRGEIDSQYLDSGAIREELGWAPRWDLDAGLATAFCWYRTHVGAASTGNSSPA